MYQVTCDDAILYDPRINDLVLIDPVLKQTKNTPGELTFEIPQQHEQYASIAKLKSVLKVYRDGVLIWKGRVISDEQDLFATKQISAEGALAHLVDSVVRPYTFEGTVLAYLTQILAWHNAQCNAKQRFILGTVTVFASTMSVQETEYLSAWQNITKYLLDVLGGYLVIRFDANENCVLDYLTEAPDTATQHIQFGVNLIDLFVNRDASSMVTACIPLGATARVIDPTVESDERLTIASVNGNLDYLIDAVLAAEYGIIFAPVQETTWDDITLPAVLKARGEEWLANSGTRLKQTIRLTAVDLHNADAEIESLNYLDRVIVSCGTLLTEAEYVLSDITIPLANPASTSIVLGDSGLSLIDNEIKSTKAISTRVETIEADYATSGDIRGVVQEEIEQNTSILQSAQQIIMSALEDYVRTQDFEALQSTIQTSFTIMAGTIEANFSETTSRISDLGGETSQEFETIRSFIRLIATGIVIGKSTSAIKLKLENDVLYFFTGSEDTVSTSNAIAYFSSGKLYVNDVQIITSLRIGNFAWVPESGNLNFKKIAG